MYVKGRLVQWKGRVLILVWCSAIPRSSNDTYERQLCLGKIINHCKSISFLRNLSFRLIVISFLKAVKVVRYWNEISMKTSVGCFSVSVYVGQS